MGLKKYKDHWKIDFSVFINGKRKRFRETAHIKSIPDHEVTKKMAEEYLIRKKANISENGIELARMRKSPLYEDFAKRYMEQHSKINKKSWERDETSLKHLIPFFNRYRMDQISTFVISKYKSERIKATNQHGKPVAPATVNRELALLKNMFTKAIDWDVVSKNPASKVKLFKENNGVLRVLSDEEFNRLYNAAAEHLKPILLVAINSGLRRSEILNLRWDEIKDNHLIVRESKNNEIRMVPFNVILTDTFNALRQDKVSDYVFCNSNGEPYKSVKNSFRTALRGSGIANARFHDLRHTFGSGHIMAGTDIVTLKELMGHKSIEMTLRYSHPTPEHKLKAMRNVNIEASSRHLLDTSDTKRNLKVL